MVANLFGRKMRLSRSTNLTQELGGPTTRSSVRLHSQPSKNQLADTLAGLSRATNSNLLATTYFLGEYFTSFSCTLPTEDQELSTQLSSLDDGFLSMIRSHRDAQVFAKSPVLSSPILDVSDYVVKRSSFLDRPEFLTKFQAMLRRKTRQAHAMWYFIFTLFLNQFFC